jgi:hypothetical protein
MEMLEVKNNRDVKISDTEELLLDREKRTNLKKSQGFCKNLFFLIFPCLKRVNTVDEVIRI